MAFLAARWRLWVAVLLSAHLVSAPGAAKKAKASPPAPKATVALVIVNEGKPNPKLAAAVRARLKRPLPSLPAVRFLTGPGLAKAAKSNPLAAVAKCGTDLKCLAALGQKAAAKKVLVLRISAAGSGITVASQVIDSETSAKDAESTLTLASVKEVKAGLEAYVQKLLPDPTKTQTPSAPLLTGADSSPAPADAPPPVPEGPELAAIAPDAAAQSTPPSPSSSPSPPASPPIAAAVPAVAAEPEGTPLPATRAADPTGQATAAAAASLEDESRAPTTSRQGTRGIERLEAAWPTAAQDVVISLSADGYRGKGLFAANDTDTLFHEQLYVTWAPIEGLELTASQSFSSNENSAWKPSSIKILGSPSLGVKIGTKLGQRFALGAAVRALVPTSPSGGSLGFEGTSVSGLLAGSWQATRFLGLTLNVGYLLDRSGRLYDAKLGPVQRFAAGVSDANQVQAGLGAETDWRVGESIHLGPFAEVTGGVAAGNTLTDSPVRATLGTKLQLFGPSRIELSAGGEVALSGKASAATSSVAGLAPWTAFLRIAGHLGSWLTAQAPAVAVSTCVVDADCRTGTTCMNGTCVVVQVEQVIKEVVQAPASYRISGKVINKSTNDPLDSASITISGYESTPIAVNRKTGEYVSFALPCGEGLVQVTAAADGFRQEQKVISQGADQQVVTVDFALQSVTERQTADLKGSLKDAANGQPIQGVVFIPALNLNIRTDEEGRFAATFNAGRYQVLITSPKYQTQKKDVLFRGGDSVILNVDMVAK